MQFQRYNNVSFINVVFLRPTFCALVVSLSIAVVWEAMTVLRLYDNVHLLSADATLVIPTRPSGNGHVIKLNKIVPRDPRGHLGGGGFRGSTITKMWEIYQTAGPKGTKFGIHVRIHLGMDIPIGTTLIFGTRLRIHM